ncbi:MAG: DEAD/DEAH box helicase [Spirochaetes bacterium]|nr:DEAD/DEAH box helicase [Spirochaetota bacterium]
MKLENFKNLGLSEDTVRTLEKKGFEEPTEIQLKAIPLILGNECDVIGQAQTGTGKTAAFGLPLIELLEGQAKAVQAIILVPTRELAIQVAEEMNSFKGRKKLSIVPIYGGQSVYEQERRLKTGIDIVVGTPGRVNDHLNRKNLNLSKLKFIVLDEADEMLNMGFIDEIETILAATNEEKRTFLFSATMPDRIKTIAKKYMKDYESVKIERKHTSNDLTEQIYFEVDKSDKLEALCRIIDIEQDFYGLIFCRTKVMVDEVTTSLIDRGYNAEGIHGDLTQAQRERVYDKFKKKVINILIATDVAARGLDVRNLSHVINYSIPQDPESYVHRIGRTGRAGQKGVAVTFVTSSEYSKLMFIAKITKSSLKKEKLPDAAEVIDTKKQLISESLAEIIEKSEHLPYRDIALSFMQIASPEDVLASLIKFTLETELDEKRYNPIRERSVDRKGKARLFVSIGKKDGINIRKLVDMIKNEAGVQPRKINDVKIMETFSFITVPFDDAERILKTFSRGKGKNKPVFERAKN